MTQPATTQVLRHRSGTDHLARMFEASCAQHGHRVATRLRVNGAWVTQTYDELLDGVHRLALAFMDAGIVRGDRVAMFANNLPEWSQADFALLSIGAIPVPIYATSTAEQVAHIVGDSGSRMIVIGGPAEAARVVEAKSHCPLLEGIVSIAAVPEFTDAVVTLPDFISPAPVTDEQARALEMRLAEVSGDDLASIIYTSGTTGAPKGVMLSHRAFVAELAALDLFFDITPDDHSLSFLPLSHAFERAWTLVVLSHGCMNTYVPNAKQVADMMVLAQPTMMVSVPKLFETVYSTARGKVAGDATKQRIFDWALRVGGQMQRAYRKGKVPNAYWRAQLPLADKLVLSNVRDAMGGPKKVLAAGGAPLRREVEEFFSACGILVCQGYGLTETAPLITFNAPDAFKFGTAGRVMPGGQLRIGAEGEILYKGPNLMDGYWNAPEATAAAIDDEGWLHTGDVGYVDTDGFLVITDRLKDIIVTLGGKNVAPQPIEGLLLADPLFEHAVLLGDNRPCLTLLVKPSMPHLAEIAEKLHISYANPNDLMNHPEVVEEVRRRTHALTAKLPSHEQIRDLRVLLEDFTMENGLLTPTLKVKRREVEKRFSNVIDDMYERIQDRRKS